MDDATQRVVAMLKSLPQNFRKYLGEIDSLDDFQAENTLENLKWILRLVDARLDHVDVSKEFIQCAKSTARELTIMDDDAEKKIGFRPGADMFQSLACRGYS